MSLTPHQEWQLQVCENRRMEEAGEVEDHQPPDAPPKKRTVLTPERQAAMQAGLAKKSRTLRVYSGKFRGEVKP